MRLDGAGAGGKLKGLCAILAFCDRTAASSCLSTTDTQPSSTPPPAPRSETPRCWCPTRPGSAAAPGMGDSFSKVAPIPRRMYG